MTDLTSSGRLPTDASEAKLIGRVWASTQGVPGPSVVIVDRGTLYDVTEWSPTISDILNSPDPAELWGSLPRTLPLCTVDEIFSNTRRGPSRRTPYLQAPCDIQAVKACGVTFARSLLERVVEERLRGNGAQAGRIRQQIEAEVGQSLQTIKPGSAQAAALKERLVAIGAWSQYLEVGLGPDAEVFTKAQPMSVIGYAHPVGVLPESLWNNPEPEVVLAVCSRGRIVGATLGNDVNLRDYEGRSALLLGRAKDNNSSCAIGPFIRLLDDRFTLDDVRRLDVELQITGLDGFTEHAVCSMRDISRDIEELVVHAMGAHHQYPDGMMLFTGTMYTPTTPRDTSSAGFTHQRGDIVRIHSQRLGTLSNEVDYTDSISPWTFGIGALLRNLAQRGLLATRDLSGPHVEKTAS